MDHIQANLVFGVTTEELLRYAATNPRFKANLLGYLAEIKLIEELCKIPEIVRIDKIADSDTSQRGDLLVHISERSGSVERIRQFVVECKTCISGKVRLGVTATRPIKVETSSIPKETRLLPRNEWDVLAIASYSDSAGWSFSYLPEPVIPDAKSDGFLKSNIYPADLPTFKDFLECTHVANTLTDRIN